MIRGAGFALALLAACWTPVTGMATSRTDDGLKPGAGRVSLPAEYAAHAMVFRTFDKVSYGDVLSRITNDVDAIGQTLGQLLGQGQGRLAGQGDGHGDVQRTVLKRIPIQKP